MKANTMKSFTELGQIWHQSAQNAVYKALTIKNRFNHYLSPDDAVYDLVVGHDHIALDDIFCGSIVTMNDRRTLMQYGFTHFRLRYNRDCYVTVPLDEKRGPSLNPTARHGRPFA